MIICLSAFKGSGKDTLCEYLAKTRDAVRVALADTLKNSVADEYRINRYFLDDPKLKEKPLLDLPIEPKDAFTKMVCEFMFKEFRSERGDQPLEFEWKDGHFLGKFEGWGLCRLFHTPRSLAILKGSTNRVVRSDFWVNKAFERIEEIIKYSPDGTIAVVTDLRYKSEVKQFQERFGKDVLFIRINRFEKSPSNDPSELDLVDHEFDYYIDNTGSLDSMYGQMDEILAGL